MVNYFPAHLEVGRTARPPMTPYVKTDSLGACPWTPSGEPHAEAPERGRPGQKSPNHSKCDQDISIGQYVLYRIRFVLPGDLAGAWADFGGLLAQINLIALVTDMATADRPVIAITYDR